MRPTPRQDRSRGSTRAPRRPPGTQCRRASADRRRMVVPAPSGPGRTTAGPRCTRPPSRRPAACAAARRPGWTHRYPVCQPRPARNTGSDGRLAGNAAPGDRPHGLRPPSPLPRCRCRRLRRAESGRQDSERTGWCRRRSSCRLRPIRWRRSCAPTHHRDPLASGGHWRRTQSTETPPPPPPPPRRSDRPRPAVWRTPGRHPDQPSERLPALPRTARQRRVPRGATTPRCAGPALHGAAARAARRAPPHRVPGPHGTRSSRVASPLSSHDLLASAQQPARSFKLIADSALSHGRANRDSGLFAKRLPADENPLVGERSLGAVARLRRCAATARQIALPRTRHAVEWASALTGRRARIPVTFATAKLMPFRLRAGGTPGIGRGQPEAR